MYFQVTNILENVVQPSVTKVRANLRNGVAEFYPGHVDMMGRIDNDVILTESTVEGRTVTREFLVRDGLVVISNGGLTEDAPIGKATYVLVQVAELIELSGVIDDKKVEDINNRLKIKDEKLVKALAKIELELSSLNDLTLQRLAFESNTGVIIRGLYDDCQFLNKALESFKGKRKY
jgi:hypothetical protein